MCSRPEPRCARAVIAVRRCRGAALGYRSHPQRALERWRVGYGVINGGSMDGLDEVLGRQSGVVSRRQLADLGLAPHDVRRLLRRRDLVAHSPGVYLRHTGESTWLQSAWCSVLAVWPAALCHQSALHAAMGESRPGRNGLFHVGIDRNRSPATPAGVRLHRISGLQAKVQWHLGPPRLRVEEAAIDVAAEPRGDFAAVAVLADVVQARHTTAARLQIALAGRSRIARRAFLDDVLVDVAEGTCSVLEHGYLTRVERPHGLPTDRRQQAGSSRGTVYRDVAYPSFRRLVELDGRLFHDNAIGRDHDLQRDLDSAVEGQVTVRLGWGQVFGTPCRTAAQVGYWLQAGGWTGTSTRCSECRAG